MNSRDVLERHTSSAGRRADWAAHRYSGGFAHLELRVLA